MLWPHFDVGALCQPRGAATRARSARFARWLARLLQCRRGDPDAAADRERDHVLDRVLFLADLRAGRPALTLPFGWASPRPMQLAALIAHRHARRAVAHLFLTESYRHAPPSVVAPFDYSTMLWALMFGYCAVRRGADMLVYVGAAIVAAPACS